MAGRGAYLRNKQTHDQRVWPEERRTKIGNDTSWIASFVDLIAGTKTPITVDSILCLTLGATREEREVKLRKLSNMGWLHMYVVRGKTSNVFIRYEWTVL